MADGADGVLDGPVGECVKSDCKSDWLVAGRRRCLFGVGVGSLADCCVVVFVWCRLVVVFGVSN